MVANVITGPKQKSVCGNALETNRGGCRCLETEVIKRTVVYVARFPRQAIIERHINDTFIAVGFSGASAAVLRRRDDSEVHPAVVFRVFAREYTIESLIEGEAIKTHRRRNGRSDDLAP